jgi:hypothetical protein
MKKLLITLLLISPFSFADWDDVYYCQMTHFSDITLDGKDTNYTLEKITFKLDKTKNAMVFGKGGYFNNTEMELRADVSYPPIESWEAEDNGEMSAYRKGKFTYAKYKLGITAIIADCDKF